MNYCIVVTDIHILSMCILESIETSVRLFIAPKKKEQRMYSTDMIAQIVRPDSLCGF